MNFSILEPFLKKYAEGITAADVAAQMQNKTKDLDKNTETVDSEAIEVADPSTQQEKKNEEGGLLEQGFKELEVEEAIEKAKEAKKLDENATNEVLPKTASLWDCLKNNYERDDRRKNST